MASKGLTRREVLLSSAAAAAAGARLRGADGRRRNLIFILSDDHRYDAMGFLGGQKFLRTPHMDQMARDGVHAKNAFVTTALCSPSRASILTGQYAHRHKVVDNNHAVPPGTVFFPQLLQKAGYQTAFIGKWHMGGESDEPQPGFHRWVSFRGQGHYLPHPNGLNVDGRRVPQHGYITDELTDYALDWLRARPADRPFFLYLSHKAVHADFVPAERHRGLLKNERFVPPASMEPASPARHRPLWVQNQRNSWHGVDFPYHTDLDIAEYYKRYAETLMAVDDSLGRVMAFLRDRNLFDSTLVVYMGDNGFAFGEHGLIDKRTAYEESMRVPMLLQCPELFGRGRVMNQIVANIDIAPTALDAAGLKPPAHLDGRSFLGLAQGRETPWREALLYEYYWERNFPHTPTIHALRGDRYKYIRCHGLWDVDELYDLREDPLEMSNLIFSEKHREIARGMNRRLFELLEQTDGMSIPLQTDSGGQQNKRHPGRGRAADFPEQLLK